MTEAILVTGFGPFAGHARNPSQQIASSMHGESVKGYRFVACPLETSWQRAWTQLQSAAELTRPVALVMLGVSFDPFFRLETVARNEVAPERDVDGISPLACAPLVPDGPSSYLCSLPLQELVPRLCSRTDFHVEISTDAGLFICTQIYYLARHLLSASIPFIGFVHVPPYRTNSEDEDWERKLTLSGKMLLSEIASALRSCTHSGRCGATSAPN